MRSYLDERSTHFALVEVAAGIGVKLRERLLWVHAREGCTPAESLLPLLVPSLDEVNYLLYPRSADQAATAAASERLRGGPCPASDQRRSGCP